MTRRRDTVVYLDRLCLLSGIRLLIVALTRRVSHVRYLSADGAGQALVRALTALGLFGGVQRFSPDLTLGDHRGGSVFDQSHHLAREVGQRVAERMCVGRSVADLFPAGVQSHRRRGLLHKMIQLESYEAVLLALLADEHLRASGNRAEVVVIARLSDLAPVLERELREDIEAQFIGYAYLKNWVVTSVTRFLATVVVGCAGRIVASFRGGGSERPPPTVAVQYLHGIEGPTFLTNDLWWYPASGLPPERCTLFFDRPRFPATDEILSDVEQRGYKARILRRDANRSSRPTDGFPFQPLGRTLEDLRLLASVLFGMRSFVAPRWQVVLWLTTMIPVRRWQGLMHAANARVVFSVGETGNDSLSMAADLAGAVRTGYHWSAIYPLNARHLPIHQVYFAWGSRNVQMFSESGRGYTDAILLGGCIFDLVNEDPESTENRDAARSDLGLRHVRHVVAALDKSMGGYYGANRHLEFYDALVSWAESDPSIGLVFKYKSQRDVPEVFRHAPELARRVEELVVAGRTVLLDGTHPVRDAVLLADVVVGLGWNSAGIVASIHGARTVFWDPAALLDGPAREGVLKVGWDNPAVVFPDLDQLVESVRSYLADPTVMPQLGDLSRVSHDVDPFRDGRAAERVGSFVRSFLESLEHDQDHTAALERALDTYARTWGTDTVIRREGGGAVRQIGGGES